VSECVRAKMYEICSAGTPDLDDCWSACNGIDGFGHEDPEIDKVRRRHGEWVESLPLSPRLILFRRHKKSALEAKLWIERDFTALTDDRLLLASLAKAMIGLPANWFNIDLWDIAPDKKDDFDGRYLLNVEVCANYCELRSMKKIYRKFFKVFDHGGWE